MRWLLPLTNNTTTKSERGTFLIQRLSFTSTWTQHYTCNRIQQDNTTHMILLYINMNIHTGRTHTFHIQIIPWYIRLIIHTHTLHTYYLYTHGTYKTQNKLLIVQAVVNEFNDSFSRFLTLMIALDRPRKPPCSPAIDPVNCVFY